MMQKLMNFAYLAAHVLEFIQECCGNCGVNLQNYGTFVTDSQVIALQVFMNQSESVLLIVHP